MLSALGGTIMNRSQVGRSLDISEEIIKGIQATEIVNWNYYYLLTFITINQRNPALLIVRVPVAGYLFKLFS
jgi:hypothetical protein